MDTGTLNYLRGGEPDEPVRLPVLSNYLYKQPNPDGTRKLCANCHEWLSQLQACKIHDEAALATADSVCGYHVYGTPSPIEEFSRGNMLAIQPEYSGLRQVVGGASCDLCTHYQRGGSLQGACLATQDFDEIGTNPVVAALGFCARFEAQDEAGSG